MKDFFLKLFGLNKSETQMIIEKLIKERIILYRWVDCYNVQSELDIYKSQLIEINNNIKTLLDIK